jgi:hypothetical protein
VSTQHVIPNGDPELTASGRYGPSTELVRILAVDDRREDLLALRAVLGGPDYEVVTARVVGQAARTIPSYTDPVHDG